MANVLGMARRAQSQKRRIYLTLLGLGAFGAVVALVVNVADGTPEPAIAVASVLTLLLTFVLALLTRNPRVPLVAVEAAIFVTFTAVVIGNLGFGLYLGSGDTGAIEGAKAVLHWVPALFIFAYIAFGTTTAGWAAFGVFIAVVAVTAPAALGGVDGGAFGPNSAAGIVQVYLAHVVALAALSFFAGIQQRLVAWREAAHEMRLMALTDPLTGLANRRWGEEQLEQELLRAARYGRTFAAVMLDIDRFKTLNDTHGHGAGDRVLIDLAHLLRKLLRATDHVVRWGGEEFLILAPETRLEAAVDLSEAVRQRVAADVLGDGHRATVSIGVATYHPGDVAISLIERADAALYRAKRGGRDRVEVEWPPPNADAAGANGTNGAATPPSD
jgi:diguanylate cyclase